MVDASSPESRSPLKVATIGAAFSANKGAASMLQAVIDELPSVAGGCRVTVLSTYPYTDRQENPNSDVAIVSLTPRELLFPVLPLALIVGFLRRLGVEGGRLAIHPALRALMDADVVADLAGISFVDGRGLPTLAYNILMTGVPLLVGAPTVKCSQALGPFRQLPTRLAARLILPRLAAIVARGRDTLSHLDELGLANVHLGSDLAFLMHGSPESDREADRLLSPLGGRDFVAVAPSSVVKAYCDGIGIDYVELTAAFCDRIISETGIHVVLVAHSSRPSSRPSRMNDVPVCHDIVARLAEPNKVLFLDGSLTPSVLRAVIGRARALVTSRFHGMVSALATETPVMVVGWSHKYGEVLTDFGLEKYAVPYDQLTVGGLCDLFEALLTEEGEVTEQIAAVLPGVRAESRRSLFSLAQAGA